MPGTEGHGYFRCKLAAGKSRNEALASNADSRTSFTDAWWPMLAPALPSPLDTEAPSHGVSNQIRSLTRFSGQFTCRHHAASAAAAGLLSYSTGLRSPIEV